jgi:hypothetical protein
MNLIVKFGGLSVGESTARLGVAVARENLDLDDADASLCGRRLTATIIGRSVGTANGDQTALPGMEAEDAKIDGVFDVKKFGVTASRITFGLTANLKDIDISTLSHFPTREGELRIDKIGPLPDGDDEDDEDDDGDEDPKDEAEPPATRGRPRRKTEATP